MTRTRASDEGALAAIEEEMAHYDRALREGELRRIPEIEGRLVQRCGPENVLRQLLHYAARTRARMLAYQQDLEKKVRLIQRILAAPRRIGRVLGLLREGPDEQDAAEPGAEDVWAVIKGPPTQAVRLHPDLDPAEVFPEPVEEPVWVWILESADSLVVTGRITPPALLVAEEGLRREMVFEGLVEEGE